MQLLDDLRAEHETIERVALSLLTFARAPRRDDAAAFVEFFRAFAGSWHHGREEELLFTALERDAQLPAHRGPIAVLHADHESMAVLLEQIAAADEAALPDLATRYAHALLQHIDAENSVLFPESEERLRRVGIRELAWRSIDARELAALALADDLTRRYPPATADSLVRGDGCVMCPAYGDSCQGLEREWWNEWEWETLGAAD